MKKQLTYIAPLRAGIILGVIYGLVGLIIVPFFVFGAFFGAMSAHGTNVHGGNSPLASSLLSLLFPVLYAMAGFIGGVIVAAIYNWVVTKTGGLEFEMQDVPPGA